MVTWATRTEWTARPNPAGAIEEEAAKGRG